MKIILKPDQTDEIGEIIVAAAICFVWEDENY